MSSPKKKPRQPKIKRRLLRRSILFAGGGGPAGEAYTDAVRPGAPGTLLPTCVARGKGRTSVQFALQGSGDRKTWQDLDCWTVFAPGVTRPAPVRTRSAWVRLKVRPAGSAPVLLDILLDEVVQPPLARHEGTA